MPIRKALLVDRESKVVSYLLCGEYELKLHGLNCRRNITLAGTKSMLPSREKEDPDVPNINKRVNKWLNQRQQHQPPILKL